MCKTELAAGDDFSICGESYRIIEIECGSVVLESARNGRRFVYGLRALQQILMHNGYKIKED